MLTPAELRALLKAEAADARAEAEATGDVGAVQEAALFTALALSWERALRPVLAAAESFDADGDGALDPDEVEALKAAVLAAVSLGFAGSALARFGAAVAESYETARRDVIVDNGLRASVGFALRATDERAVAALARSHGWYVTNAGERRVEPEVEAVARRVLSGAEDGGGLSRDDAGAALRDGLGGVYARGLTYWRLLANAAVQESREFGRLSAYEAAGVEHVYLDAVRDRRTSGVCEFLDGRRIAVADMAAVRDRVLAARPEDRPDVNRWWGDRDVAPGGRLRALVERAGGDVPAEVGTPGYHGHCRTRTVVKPPRR